jgi:hypothetical protein
MPDVAISSAMAKQMQRSSLIIEIVLSTAWLGNKRESGKLQAQQELFEFLRSYLFVLFVTRNTGNPQCHPRQTFHRAIRSIAL